MIIYKITNKINGKTYIGQTKNDLKRRLCGHKNKGKIFHNALNKYGEENFIYEILEKCSNKDELNNKEIYWINKYNTLHPNGYNLTSGGQGQTEYSDIIKRKMSEKAKIRCSSSEYKEKFKKRMSICIKKSPDFSGVKNPRYRDDIDDNELLKMYENKSLKEIREHFKCGLNTIYRRIKKIKNYRKKRIQKNTTNYKKIGEINPRYRKDLDNKNILEMNKTMSIQEIAINLKAGINTIRRRLNEIRSA